MCFRFGQPLSRGTTIFSFLQTYISHTTYKIDLSEVIFLKSQYKVNIDVNFKTILVYFPNSMLWIMWILNTINLPLSMVVKPLVNLKGGCDEQWLRMFAMGSEYDRIVALRTK